MQSSIAARGRNRRGETRLRGPEVLGPLRGLGIRPLVSVIRGLGNPFQRPLRAPERLSEPRGGSSEASERGVRFQRSGKTRWATQRPLEAPFSRMPPEGVPTLGFLPSGPQIKSTLILFFLEMLQKTSVKEDWCFGDKFGLRGGIL